MSTVERTGNLALPSGTMLFEYRLEKMLGKGGFGLTYLAIDVDLGRRVAIKELLPDGIAMRGEGTTVVAQTNDMEETFQWASERFLEEARTLARLTQPNIVKVIRYLKANQTVYMVMDFIQGRSLDQIVKDQGGALPEPQVRAILSSLLTGIEYVHSQDILHRDIKPANVLITPDGTPVLIDFGSARENLGRTVAMTSVVSFGYSPWEQITTNGRQGPWTDIYALAATTIFMMTGRSPKSAADRVGEPEAEGWLVEQLGDRYNEAFLRGVEWAFRLRAQDRPQSAAEWRSYLDQVPTAQSSPERSHSAIPAFQPPPSVRTGMASTQSPLPHQEPVRKIRNLTTIGLVTAAVLILLIIVAIIFWPSRPSNETAGASPSPASDSNTTANNMPESKPASVPPSPLTTLTAPAAPATPVPTPAPIPPPASPAEVQPPPQAVVQAPVTPMPEVTPTPQPEPPPSSPAPAITPTPVNTIADALKELTRLANQGNADAQLQLGEIYEVGTNVPQDYALAFQWYAKAAAQNNSTAQVNIGTLYAKGNGTRQDYSQALSYYLKAASQGVAMAQRDAAVLYSNGLGVPKDYSQAAQWFEKAGDQGDAPSQAALGLLYANGWGVTKDYSKAAQWFRKAADQGNADGENGLGALYQTGAGVPRDINQARSWYQRAASRGNAQAQANLIKLGR